MTDMTRQCGQRNFGWVRWVGWGAVVALLLIPLAAMRFAPGAGFNWTVGDFVFAAMMFGAVGLAAELAVRISSNWAYRGGASLGLAAGFLLVWANGAVGYIGDDNPYNMVFFVIVALAFIGSVLARFQAKGMALTMLAAAIAHAIAGAIGFPQDPITGPITIVFTGMWLASAALFRKAAKEGATA